jgi:hypothetical protein
VLRNLYVVIWLVAPGGDFYLAKVKVPANLRVLVGKSFPKPREEVRNGTVHTAVQELAAFAESVCLPISEVLLAYGERNREITGSRIAGNLSKSTTGLHLSHVCIDGMSIWAAATSPGTVLLVHLLP